MLFITGGEGWAWLCLQNLRVSSFPRPLSCCSAEEEAPSHAVLRSAAVVALTGAGRSLTNVIIEQLLAVGFKCDIKQDTIIILI